MKNSVVKNMMAVLAVGLIGAVVLAVDFLAAAWHSSHGNLLQKPEDILKPLLAGNAYYWCAGASVTLLALTFGLLSWGATRLAAWRYTGFMINGAIKRTLRLSRDPWHFLELAEKLGIKMDPTTVEIQELILRHASVKWLAKFLHEMFWLNARDIAEYVKQSPNMAKTAYDCLAALLLNCGAWTQGDIHRLVTRLMEPNEAIGTQLDTAIKALLLTRQIDSLLRQQAELDAARNAPQKTRPTLDNTFAAVFARPSSNQSWPRRVMALLCSGQPKKMPDAA